MQARTLHNRMAGLFFYEWDKGTCPQSYESYKRKWPTYDAFLEQYRSPHHEESLIDALTALTEWNLNFNKQGERLALEKFLRTHIEKMDARHGYRYGPLNIEVVWREDDSIDEEQFARIEPKEKDNRLLVEVTTLSTSSKGRRFAIEMLLHESRHFYQSVYNKLPIKADGKLSEAEEHDSPWERDARAFQLLVSNLYFNGSANIEELDKSEDSIRTRNAWVGLGNLLDNYWQYPTTEETIDRVLSLKPYLEAFCSVPTPAGNLLNIIKRKSEIAKLVSDYHFLLEHDRRKLQIQCVQPSLKALTAKLHNTIDYELSDKALLAERNVHLSYSYNRLGFAADSRDKQQTYYLEALFYAVEAISLVPLPRYAKYIADNLSRLANILENDHIRSISEMIFIDAYCLRTLEIVNWSYVRKCASDNNQLFVAYDGSSMNLKNDYIDLIAEIPSYSTNKTYARVRASEFRNAAGSGIISDIYAGLLILIQRSKDFGWNPNVTNLRSKTFEELSKEDTSLHTVLSALLLANLTGIKILNNNIFQVINLLPPDEVDRISILIKRILRNTNSANSFSDWYLPRAASLGFPMKNKNKE